MLLVLQFFSILFVSWNAPEVDSLNKAQLIFVENLSVIKSRLDGNLDENWKVSRSIRLMEQLTGINSESPGGFHGKNFPTQIDYQRWSEWYNKNKNFLKWNKRKKAIILYKEVKVL